MVDPEIMTEYNLLTSDLCRMAKFLTSFKVPNDSPDNEQHSTRWSRSR